MTETIIDESNFEQFFFDVRKHKPQRGQIMARYTAMADFVDGMMKKHIIDLLHRDKAEAAVAVMRKLGCATEPDSMRVVREVCDDLLSGMTPAEVELKAYKYQLESFYYTDIENVPKDDPHWSVINIRNMDDFLDASNNKCKIKSKVVDSLDVKREDE